jgi:hypothetical protein
MVCRGLSQMLIHGDREPVSCVVVMKLPNLGALANLTNPRLSAIARAKAERADPARRGVREKTGDARLLFSPGTPTQIAV